MKSDSDSAAFPKVQPTGDQPFRIAILAPEASLGWTVTGPMDMLSSATVWDAYQGAAADTARQLQVSVIGRSHDPVRCYGGARLLPDATLDDADYSPHAVIVPSMFQDAPNFARTGWARPWAPFLEWLLRAHACGALIGAISNGVALLAETGLLNGRQATTHWAIHDALAARHPSIEFVRDQRLVFATKASRLATTAAGAAWQHLVLQIVAATLGNRRATELARLFGMQSADGAFVPVTHHGDVRILRAQKFIASSYETPDALLAAAEKAQLPRRTFERRFRLATGLSPLAYLQEVRIQNARSLLESTDWSVNDIAENVGYTDLPHFRTLFLRRSHLTPSRYRVMHNLSQMMQGVTVRA